ncbi:MAG: hypothetical protein NC038_03625 [Paludibacter sp.]|nr:hypothetical protein [Bacteroidales bacterium]MCM1069169.1 hypothetical protein [Prevotella sp.]MCM1354074.1 hypothetical protein [Bacteroides sp.]MCM1442953.1 hypothetical protein [Muribaculum sp.]MCM1481724.1 hypothetical protein [Paludibacter sp.]
MMKKVLFIAVVVLGAFTACSKTTTEQTVVYTINEVYDNADSLLNDTITFQGICTHLCKHGGRKAFLMGTDESRILRVEGAGMGHFEADCINNIVRVQGILRATEIQPEQDNALPSEQHGEDGNGCETEKKAIRTYYAEAIAYEIVQE